MEFQISVVDLPFFAKDLWKLVGDRKILAFHGPMGAGKTTIIAALCKEKGVQDAIGSPTFSIINEYATKEGEKIFHLDLYRLKDEEEVMSAGVEDCLDSGNICLVEWPEKAPDLFDESAFHVWIEVLGENERKIFVRQ